MQVFPRIPEQDFRRQQRSSRRLPTGVPGLDEITGGGIPEGDVVMLTGPAGSGKTTFAAQFLAQGLAEGENCVVAVFEEFPQAYLMRAKTSPIDLREMVEVGRLAVIYLRPLDLSVDEMLFEILVAVQRLGATRVVIDSLSGFEIALAPTFRADFRESLYRLVGALTATGVTVMMTAEVVDVSPAGGFTNERVSFVTDDIFVQRYVEIGGHLRKVLAVVKMRGSEHATDFREYTITTAGAVIGQSLGEYHGITTGVPELAAVPPAGYPGLTDDEIALLSALAPRPRSSAEDLATLTGVAVQTLRERLERLIALAYVVRDGASGDGYSAVARADKG
jgi:circadian clock protein KaiC